MDFFARQDDARRKSGLLMFYFSLAVACTILLVYFLPVLAWNGYQSNYGPRETRTELSLWHPDLFVFVCGATLIVVFCGALFKIAQLRRGGGAGVAEMLGGRPVPPGTADFFERRLRNIVEEMAIAAGMPVPPVYVLDRERGINAFAAGFTPADSVVAVTHGAMTGLSRDELQGVVAHEFSHILNSDTRMNVNLMGIIHGLVIIGLTGRIVLEFAGRSARHRSSKDSGQVAAFAIAAGLILWIVGSCGMFFAQLIKAAISRSRERLADASAVQFTRNPAGLAGALKKIGGLAEGSRLLASNAEQASHLFFGKGTRGSLFSTHPPLAERVRWLDPRFDGQFPPVALDDLRENLARFEGAPKVEKKQPAPPLFATVAAAAIAPRPNNPEALIDSIGAPLQRHADAARRLIDSIPEQVKAYARDPYGARMLVYFLLLDPDDSVRKRQMDILQREAEPEVYRTLLRALPNLGVLRPEIRLPVFDLAIPALRFLSPRQYLGFRAVLKQLIDADARTDVFEYALQRLLVHHLDPAFSGNNKPKPANYYAIRGLQEETSTLLSVLARQGQSGEEAVRAAFRAGADRIADPKANFELVDGTKCTWERLDHALDRLNEGSFKVKKWVLGAALSCLMHDREITVEEVELFRAIADTLGCPVPPWVAPAKLG